MSLHEVQNFLARIYTDENLRRDFVESPQTIGKINNLSETEIAELAEILPAELESFAKSLFYKRLREAEKFLPATRKILGKEFEFLFREFAPTFNPQSVKKHFEDAVKFAEFLQTKKIELNYAKDIARFERAKLKFYGSNKSFVFEVFDYDVKRISGIDLFAPNEIRRRKTAAFWLRIGKREIVF